MAHYRTCIECGRRLSSHEHDDYCEECLDASFLSIEEDDEDWDEGEDWTEDDDPFLFFHGDD